MTTPKNLIHLRREALVADLKTQLALFELEERGERLDGRWYMHCDGAYFMPVRYGQYAMEINEGMFTTTCVGGNALRKTIAEMMTYAQEGHFDAEMEFIAETIADKRLF